MSTIIDDLHSFGQLNYGSTIKHLDRSFIHTFKDKDNDKFCQLLELLLNNKDKRVNGILFNNLLFNIVNTNPEELTSIILESLNRFTVNFRDNIQSHIDSKQFSIDWFVNQYKDYYTNSRNLSRKLSYQANSITIGEKRNNLFNLVGYYVFYKNVINYKYNYKNTELYLYELLTKLVENNKPSLNCIMSLYQMNQFFIRLSYTIKNKESIFNSTIDKKFMVSLGSDQKFVEDIMLFFNKTIVEIYKNDIDDNQLSINNMTDNKLKELVNIIKFMTNLNETDFFKLYYTKLLERRLLKRKNVNTKLEKFLLNFFKKPDSNSVIKSMINKIQDIESNRKMIKDFKKIKVDLSDDSIYKDVPWDREKVNFNILRYFSWTDSKKSNYTSFKPPKEVEIYTTIFNKYYQINHTNRKLFWNYNIGLSQIKLTIADRTYNIQLTNPQLFVLLQFANKSKLTAIEIAKNLKISLAQLGNILNGFLTCELLTRDKKHPSDPTTEFCINPNFYSENIKISLKNLVGNENFELTNEEIKEEFALRKRDVIEARIVYVIKRETKLSEQELTNKVKDGLKFELKDNEYNESLEKCIKSEYIKKINENDNIVFEYLVNQPEFNSNAYNSDDESSEDSYYDSDDY